MQNQASETAAESQAANQSPPHLYQKEPLERLTRDVWSARFALECNRLAAEYRAEAYALPLPDQERAQRLARWREEGRQLTRAERILRGDLEPKRFEHVGLPWEFAARLAAHQREAEAIFLLGPEVDSTERDDLLARAAHLERKGALLKLCGRFLQVRECSGCGTERSESGVHGPTSGADWCRSRNCEVCGHFDSLERSARLENALQQIELYKDHNLYLVTFTARQEGKAARTANEMRAFVEGLRRGIRSSWDPPRELGLRKARFGLKVKTKENGTTSGLFVKCEISDRATIHAHGLYYGPFVKQKEIAEAARARFGDAGFVDVRRVATHEELALWRDLLDASARRHLGPAEETALERIGGSIREVCKYLSKAPGPRDEGYARGARRERLSPEVAAVWEAALYRVRAAASYGVFRGLDDGLEQIAREQGEQAAIDAALVALEIARARGYASARESVERADFAKVCGCCGTVGAWSWGVRPAGQYLTRCAVAGERGFPPPAPKLAILYEGGAPPN